MIPVYVLRKEHTWKFRICLYIKYRRCYKTMLASFEIIKVVKKSSRDNPLFLGPVSFHSDVSYVRYSTFGSNLKARLDSNVQCIDIRIGSDDEGGLSKAINNVFPNAARLLCSKHIKNNVTDHKE